MEVTDGKLGLIVLLTAVGVQSWYWYESQESDRKVLRKG